MGALGLKKERRREKLPAFKKIKKMFRWGRMCSSIQVARCVPKSPTLVQQLDCYARASQIEILNSLRKLFKNVPDYQ